MANNSLEGETNVSLMTTCFLCEVVISCLAVLGNSAIIIAFIVHRRLRTIQNCYIVSLAMTDFSMGFFAIPLVLLTLDGTRPKSKELCLLMLTVVVLMDLCSIFSVMALTLDRFYAVSWPFKYHAKMTYRRTILHISVAWLVPIGIASAVPLGWNNLGDSGFQGCIFAHIVSMKYYTTLYFLCFIPLFIVMCLMYSSIFRIIQGQLRALQELQAIGVRLNQQASNDTVVRYPAMLHVEDHPQPGMDEKSDKGYDKEEDKKKTKNSSVPNSNPYVRELDRHPDLAITTGGDDQANAKAQFKTENSNTHSLKEINRRPDRTEQDNVFTKTLATEESPITCAHFNQGCSQVFEEEERRSQGVHGLPNDINNTFISSDLNEKAYQRFHRIRSEKRTALLFLFIMVFLFISWSPIYIVDVCLAFDVDVSQSLVNFAVLFSHFNSAMNPFLYGYKSEFRWILKQWAFGIYGRCCKMCGNNIVAPSRPMYDHTRTGQYP